MPQKKQKATLEKPSALFASAEKRNVIFCLLLVVATLAVYNPVNSHPFVNYDDDRYIAENSHVHNGLGWDTITWAFTSSEQANWHPLTWLSHALIHASNAVLLFLLLAFATHRVGPSLFVALLFALHPINVESVAWVAERKNVLSTFFFLAAIGTYGWYARKPDWPRYLAVAGLFALGLMSKPMVITLPFVLLLLDYWPLGRVRVSLASAVGTTWSRTKLVANCLSSQVTPPSLEMRTKRAPPPRLKSLKVTYIRPKKGLLELLSA